MKKVVKNIVNTLISLIIIFEAFASASITGNASEATSKFIPFRNDYIKYISRHSDSEDKCLEYVWLKLFEEENNFENGKWSDKYFSTFVNSKGETTSSKGLTVTYNPDFDGYLYLTMINNKDFIIHWINKQPEIFSTYSLDIANHPDLADGIATLTADGFMLGDGLDTDNNVFEYGGSSSELSNLPAKPNWSIESRQDLNILRALACKWADLSKLQKDWVKTYLPYLIDDYVKNGPNAIASKENCLPLYDLMAISAEGFKRDEVAQEFFDYLIGTPDKAVGDLIVNIAKDADASDVFLTDETDISENSDLSIIFGGDGDCDYKSKKDLGDNDYDWLAYIIADPNGEEGKEPFKRLKKLISDNPTTAEQMQDWILRYFTKHTNESASDDTAKQIEEAILRQGETHDLSQISFTVRGCGARGADMGWSDNGVYCHGHSGSGYTSCMKPLGVYRITARSTNPSNDKYNCIITDVKTNKVIWNSGNASGIDYTLPSKYIWSNTIKVELTYSIYRGAGGISRRQGGECALWHYFNAYICGTYVPISHCDKEGHTYLYSYEWNDDHSACTAHGECYYCGQKKDYVDSSIDVNEADEGLSYYADFKHINGNIEPKTYLKRKGNQTEVFDSAPAISGNISSTNSRSKTWLGWGYDFPIYTSTSTSCSLTAGNIKPGASSITVSASGSTACFTLYDKHSRIVQTSSTLYPTIQQFDTPSSGNITYTFDVSDVPDSKLDGMYIAIDVATEAEGTPPAGAATKLGTEVVVKAVAKLNSITVTY